MISPFFFNIKSTLCLNRGSSLKKLEELDLFSSAIILHFILTADGTPLAKEWILYRELPDGLFYASTISGVLKPIEKKYEFLVCFNKIKKEFRNEKIIMLFILNFLFLSSELSLENISFM